MNEEQNHKTEPYEFEPELSGSGRLKAILVTTAAVLVAGGLVAGAAMALSKPAEPVASNSPRETSGTVSVNQDDSPDSGVNSSNQDQHNVVVPPVAVKPGQKPTPRPTVGSKKPPSFNKKPHFGHKDGEFENEGSDD